MTGREEIVMRNQSTPKQSNVTRQGMPTVLLYLGIFAFLGCLFLSPHPCLALGLLDIYALVQAIVQ